MRPSIFPYQQKPRKARRKDRLFLHVLKVYFALLCISMGSFALFRVRTFGPANERPHSIRAIGLAFEVRKGKNLEEKSAVNHHDRHRPAMPAFKPSASPPPRSRCRRRPQVPASALSAAKRGSVVCRAWRRVVQGLRRRGRRLNGGRRGRRCVSRDRGLLLACQVWLPVFWASVREPRPG